MNLQTVTSVENQSRVEPVTTRADSVAQVLKAVLEPKSRHVIKNDKTQNGHAHKDETQMERLLDQAEKMAGVFGRNLKFRYRKEADVYQVEVVDAQSDEIVRKIPSDEMVRFIEHINEMLGALFDEQA